MEKNFLLRILITATASLLVACGGGGGDGIFDGPAPVAERYVVWSGSANGTVVLDKSNRKFQVRLADRKVFSNESNSVLTGLQVDGNGTVVSNGKTIGGVVNVTSDANTQITVFKCSNGNRLSINESANAYSVDCGAPTTPPPAAGDAFVQWQGSSNGTVVLDKNSQKFTVRVSDRKVFSEEKSTYLDGTRVDDKGSFFENDKLIGSVGLVAGSSGSQVAAFKCSNGNLMAITLANNSFSIDCGKTEPPPEDFVSWNGSTNGTVIVDRNNRNFKVRISDRVVYSVDGNTNLNGTRVDTGGKFYLNDKLVGSVVNTTSTANTNIVAFQCSNGSFMAINLTASNYVIDCGSATPPNGGGGSGTETANQCVQLGRDSNGSATISNKCTFAISYNYCNLLPDRDGSTSFVCRAQPYSPSPTGFIYGRGSSSIQAGGTARLVSSGGAGNVVFTFACVNPGIPFITNFNTPTISSNSVPSGICR